jgi:hypothetical protein
MMECKAIQSISFYIIDRYYNDLMLHNLFQAFYVNCSLLSLSPHTSLPPSALSPSPASVFTSLVKLEWQLLIDNNRYDENQIMSYIQAQALEASRDSKLGKRWRSRCDISSISFSPQHSSCPSSLHNSHSYSVSISYLYSLLNLMLFSPVFYSYFYSILISIRYPSPQPLRLSITGINRAESDSNCILSLLLPPCAIIPAG